VAGWLEERTAQVQPQAVGGQVRPRQPREARSSTAQTRVSQEVSPGSLPVTLTRRPGLAEGALDEVEVPDAMVVFGGEPQAGGQAYPVGEQNLGRSRVDPLIPGGEVTDTGIDDLHELGTGWRLQASVSEIFQ
jgi:hypothetical protein